MGAVVNLPVDSTLDLSAERVLEGAKGEDLAGVVVIGFGRDGSEYFASSYASKAMTLWLMERQKMKLLAVSESEFVE